MNLEGNIGEIDLIARLVELWRERFTGAIRFENDGVIKILYFKDGDILSASTNDRADSIDEILMRAGKVSRDHVKQALAKRKESETLGDALLNLGFITRKELSWARRVQVVGVIRSIAAWPNGSFTIVADYLPKRDEGTLFPLPQILIELTVTEQDRTRFETAMKGGDLVLARTRSFDETFPKLGLNEDADAIAAAIDGRRSAREIASVSGRDTFNVYKLLHALALLGLLADADEPQVTSQVSDIEFGDAPAVATAGWGIGGDNSAFDFTDEPGSSLDLPPMSIPDEVPQAPEPPSILWEDSTGLEGAGSSPDDVLPPIDEPIPEALAAAPLAPEPRIGAWDAPPRETVAVPIQVPIEPAVEARQEQWGFDEAQLEASRRAIPSRGTSSPARKPATRSGGRRYGLIVSLIAIVAVAGLGYAGYLWWVGREAEPLAEAPVRTAPPPATPAAAAAPSSTETIVEAAPATETATLTTAETATASIATQAPAPAAPVATPAPARVVEAAPVAATAPMTPERARLDAMAREFAANPNGNYTVQIQILCDPGNLAQAMRAGGGQLWFVPQSLGTRSCYRVFWGRFATEREASAGMANIPRSLRDPNAAVKPVPRG